MRDNKFVEDRLIPLETRSSRNTGWWWPRGNHNNPKDNKDSESAFDFLLASAGNFQNEEKKEEKKEEDEEDEEEEEEEEKKRKMVAMKMKNVAPEQNEANDKGMILNKKMLAPLNNGSLRCFSFLPWNIENLQ